jgi:hypothetical protein
VKVLVCVFVEVEEGAQNAPVMVLQEGLAVNVPVAVGVRKSVQLPVEDVHIGEGDGICCPQADAIKRIELRTLSNIFYMLYMTYFFMWVKFIKQKLATIRIFQKTELFPVGFFSII